MDRKIKFFCRVIAYFMLCTAFLTSTSVFAQTGGKTVTGIVTDDTGEVLIGVSVLVVGTTTGTTTDLDGNYNLTLPAGTTQLQFSYMGYDTQVLTVSASGQLNVRMVMDEHILSDVVVIGYGTQRKSDLTGSVTNVSSKDFNAGLISSPEQLINGKASGVQIMSSSGSPTAGGTVRIRGGASLNASNNPLIVLDGIPLENGGISGNEGNFLSLINPNDIESITILKDASSTAIYGSRASNGVMIITTKKGTGDKLKINFSTTNSFQTRDRMVDMLNHNEFINIINIKGTAEQRALLGTVRTDWNDEVYHTAFGTDNNLSISGRINGTLPVRVSLGYYNQDGIVRSDNAERYTASINVSPTFFDDHLKITLNGRGSINNNTFANSDAIWAAATFNPTIPVYSEGSIYGGYNEASDNSGKPVTAGVRNPRGLVEQYNSTSRISRFIGNADIDYKFHCLPELKFHTTLGYDYAEGKGEVYVPAEAAQYYTTQGRDYSYGPQKNSNRLLTTYLNYNKSLPSVNSHIDATMGYDYQFWKSKSPSYMEYNTNEEVIGTSAATEQRHVLISGYARLNYTLADKYMFTGTMRRDGTSRFHKDNRWGTFPSVALAWRLTEEEFLRNNGVLSNLKLRASFGITGQQEGIGNYNYLQVYTISQNGAQAWMGDQFIYTYRPEAYDEKLKWETTTAWNIGFDFGFLDERINGGFEFYTRDTKDLLATVPSAAGTNFNKRILTNVGNVDSKGVELTLNAIPVDTEDWTWNLSYNLTWQKMKVKNLSLNKGGAATSTLVGPSIDAYQFQVLTEGYEPYMFYVYHQLYDEETGRPIEGAYADLNNDGVINSEDLYRYKSPSPDYIMGFSTSLRYKKWTLSTSLRANIGNYVYNGMGMNTGAWNTVSYNSFQLNNLNSSYLKTGFEQRQHLSDYYVENASFLKMDNLMLGYNFGRINKWMALNVSAMVQNVFCITKYSGVDPEVPQGMDLSFYPRPRTFSMSVGLEF